VAQLDIKNCDVYLKDGYAGPSGAANAKVNNVSGYTIGTTTMTVDGITGSLVTGDQFTVAGGYQRYTITAHTETLAATTSITFTPGLITAAVDNDAIKIQPHFLKIRIGEGNITWTEKRAITYTKDRGQLDTVRKGDEDPVEVKLDATWVFLKASTGQTPTIEDVLKNRGEASTWLTSSSDACEPFAVDLVIEYKPPCSTEDVEIYTIADFRYEELGHDLKQGQLSISGKSNTKEVDVQRVTAA
jgi:hypothetical protein